MAAAAPAAPDSSDEHALDGSFSTAADAKLERMQQQSQQLQRLHEQGDEEGRLAFLVDMAFETLLAQTSLSDRAQAEATFQDPAVRQSCIESLRNTSRQAAAAGPATGGTTATEATHEEPLQPEASLEFTPTAPEAPAQQDKQWDPDWE